MDENPYTKRRSPLSIGAFSGVVFWLIFVFVLLFVLRPDAQFGIALAISPFYAIVFAGFVTAIAASFRERG